MLRPLVMQSKRGFRK